MSGRFPADPHACPCEGMKKPKRGADWEPAKCMDRERVKEDNPYSLERRGEDWVVVKTATGQLVPGGNHKRDKAMAMRHLGALETAERRK